MRAARGWMVVGVAAVCLSGCKAKPASEGAVGASSSGAAAGSASRVMVSGPVGSVTGTVAYTGKAPAKVLIDTSMDPACSLNGEKVYTEQIVANAGKLANVFVYVKSGPAAAMNAADPAPKPVVLDQKGCQYVPHVIGVMAGGTVEFRNSDPTMHNVHTMPTEVGNEAIDVSQGPKGAPKDKVFQKPELMIPVRCNNHPWMNAFINVSATPFFAVTGADGSFDLRGLPPGDYVLGAVQEKLGEQTMNVTVAANGTAKAGLRFPAK
jgi:plastocyanin